MLADHFKPFFDGAPGMTSSAARRLMEACPGTADRMVGEMMEVELPTVWKHMANPDTEASTGRWCI